MNEYVIFTDSGCDLPGSLLSEWGIPCKNLHLHFDGDDTSSLEDIDIGDFYRKMREGATPKTSAVNVAEFEELFEGALSCGKDVLYIGFSSALSTTYNSARLASVGLSEKYPDRKIRVVDTLSASAGYGLIVKLVNDRKNAGATIDEAADYAEDIKLKISIWFTVDDLVYLKRGGRISAAAAFFGNMLGIKPVLRMDDEGHLVPYSKVRGRKMSLNAMADKYGQLATDHGGIAYISHGDCMADAKYLANLIETKYGAKVELITDVGPIIGSHSGPGTVALFFPGKSRLD
ncbi:MAG: DegV family protein [Clostridia bacterium]|nr:DegV family protein [Clostridia bacterium]